MIIAVVVLPAVEIGSVAIQMIGAAGKPKGTHLLVEPLAAIGSSDDVSVAVGGVKVQAGVELVRDCPDPRCAVVVERGIVLRQNLPVTIGQMIRDYGAVQFGPKDDGLTGRVGGQDKVGHKIL